MSEPQPVPVGPHDQRASMPAVIAGPSQEDTTDRKPAHDQLVERLRKPQSSLPYGDCRTDEAMQAADAITALERELQEARAEIDKAEADADAILESWKRACKERDYASGQLQEARRALAELVACKDFEGRNGKRQVKR